MIARTYGVESIFFALLNIFVNELIYIFFCCPFASLHSDLDRTSSYFKACQLYMQYCCVPSRVRMAFCWFFPGRQHDQLQQVKAMLFLLYGGTCSSILTLRFFSAYLTKSRFSVGQLTMSVPQNYTPQELKIWTKINKLKIYLFFMTTIQLLSSTLFSMVLPTV